MAFYGSIVHLSPSKLYDQDKVLGSSTSFVSNALIDVLVEVKQRVRDKSFTDEIIVGNELSSFLTFERLLAAPPLHLNDRYFSRAYKNGSRSSGRLE